MPLVAAGAACNLAAIVANGGYMPASAGRGRADGRAPAALEAGYSNSSVVADPGLWFLTDIFALPPSLPFANVFSVGDLLIGAGIAVVIVVAMRSARRPALAAGRRPADADRRRRSGPAPGGASRNLPPTARSGQYLWAIRSRPRRP